MKAAVYERYGEPEVVTIRDVATPVPKPGEVLIRNHATSVGSADSAGRQGMPRFSRLFFGPFTPKHRVLGSDFAGEIAAMGDEVTGFAVGDRVFGLTSADFGGHAQYVTVPATGPIALAPPDLTDEEAVAVLDGAMTALPFLRDHARIRAGQGILINGASGSVGTAAVQLAKHFGAHVTAVCSGANRDFVVDLGADEVIDYAVEDFTRNGLTYDVIFDVVGKSSFARCRGSLTRDGVYLLTVPSLAILGEMLWTSRFGRKKAILALTGLRPAEAQAADLLVVKQLAENGALRPVIGRSYDFARIADAHRLVDTGHKRGNVVVNIRH